EARRRFLCASCRLLQYCSRDCQRRHWHSPLQPHKEVCSTLRGLRELTTPDADVEKFRAACHTANIDVHGMAVIFTNLLGDRLIEEHDGDWPVLVDRACSATYLDFPLPNVHFRDDSNASVHGVDRAVRHCSAHQRGANSQHHGAAQGRTGWA
ncbi:hypothetical protein AURDEDRAFT_76745, partial [Auricularia subglabra TFB-10046 SS5]